MRWQHSLVVTRCTGVFLLPIFLVVLILHIKSDCCHIVLGYVHLSLSFFVLAWELLLVHHVVHLVVLGKWRPSKVSSLKHLHWVHVHSTTIWCCSCIWHTSKCATPWIDPNTHHAWHWHIHSLHIHLLKRINLLVQHVINTNLRFSSGLLWCHW